MVTIQVEPLGRSISAHKGQILSEALAQSGITIEQPCGGQGSCGCCRVLVEPQDGVPPINNEHLTPEETNKGVRLACCSVVEKACTIRIDSDYQLENQVTDSGRILESYNTQKNGQIQPAVRVSSAKKSFLLSYDQFAEPFVIDNWRETYSPKGLAIDIGTTTIVLSLIDLATGSVLATRSSLNPQVVHGHDVMTRIKYAKNPEKLKTLTDLVQSKLNLLIDEACGSANCQPDEIVDVCIGANTTMLQIAAAIDPSPLGTAPFNVTIEGGQTVPAAQFGLRTNSVARVYLPPVIHAFVGSDITAGFVTCPDFFDNEKSILFIDLGTNGEMGLNVKGKWLTTSTAAGPAFEGMGLKTGMRAKDGAVEHVELMNGKLTLHTIGNTKIKGICGSGIIALVAVLLETGALLPSGRLQPCDDLADQIKLFNDQPAFCYADGLLLTQQDIREIQLAKSAIRAGIDLILEAGGIGCEQLDAIYLAGGFGNYLQPKSMERIGLIPKNSALKIKFWGNTSVEGARLLLTDRNQRRFIERAMGSIQHLSLPSTQAFTQCYLKHLNFPEQNL